MRTWKGIVLVPVAITFVYPGLEVKALVTITEVEELEEPSDRNYTSRKESTLDRDQDPISVGSSKSRPQLAEPHFWNLLRVAARERLAINN